MSGPTQRRERLVIVGTIGSIGNAVCREFAADYEVVAVTQVHASLTQLDPDLSIVWRYCDLFSRVEMQKALQGADRTIFLVHTRIPSARLDQAQCEDMDLLIADNFARAVRSTGVRQILSLRSLLPKTGASTTSRHAGEVVKTLQSSGIPVSVIRAGLIVSPGSATLNLIGNQVLNTRFVPVPAWTLQPKQPIAERDFLRALRFCLDQPDRFTGSYEIGGPEIVDWRQILRLAARLQGVQPRFVTVRRLPKRIYARWMHHCSPHSYHNAIRFMVEDLSVDATVTDNPLQRVLAPDLQSPIEAIAPTMKNGELSRLVDQRTRTMTAYERRLRKSNSVRSIQRVSLPASHNASSIAANYFNWLQRFAWPFLLCTQQQNGARQIKLRGVGLTLLDLEFGPEGSMGNRCLYRIRGGLLRRPGGNEQARMEFRDVLDGTYTIIAIHDFVPALPWQFYLRTQAAIHLFVMRAFQRYITKRIAAGELPKAIAVESGTAANERERT